ncbi:MAG: hypothetical protein FJ320_02810 [SAR202 cluster bacterium]|nr:hypothetical protein [SAR202 cluster bacterium]
MGVDPNKVLLTGENPFLRLGPAQGQPFTTNASFWRILLSTAGPGHVLFLLSELTEGRPRVYSDNINLARWMQRTLEGPRKTPFGDEELAVEEARFRSSGDLRAFWTEEVVSSVERIRLTWHDLGEPFIAVVPTGGRPGAAFGIYGTIIPARAARLTLNGKEAQGRVFPQDLMGGASSTCGLAFSETWLVSR